jgi:molybdopterin synthase catalytic subunit
MIDARLVTEPIDARALTDHVAGPECGAVSLFLGTVRDQNDGRVVTGIEYSAYDRMAQSELRAILTEAEQRWSVERIIVLHRLGTLAVGDVSIGIAVAHPHRAQAMVATSYIIEEVKRRVPIWKRELYADGTREWVDPTRPRAEAAR